MAYDQKIETLTHEKGPDYQGLNEETILKSRDSHGKNVFETKKPKSVWLMIFDELKQFLNLLLMAAAIVSIVVSGHLTDGIFIMAIVVLNISLSVFQEKKASDAISALKNLTKPHAKVIRNGETLLIEKEDLVVGDIVILEAGDFVPADLRLLDSVNLKIDESSLTGESVASLKDASKVLTKSTALGDRVNMAYSGTIVTYGRGLGIVTAVGMKSEMGLIAGLLNETEDTQTPLQLKIDKLGKLLGLISIVAVVMVFIVGLLYGMDLDEIFIISVSLAVAAIPEGLPTVITVVLALGMRKMASKKAIVKSLSAVETLGSVTVISSDKTGTLTQNKMVVTTVYDGHEMVNVSGDGYSFKGTLTKTSENVHWITKIAALTNDAMITDRTLLGDPTELALVVLAEKNKMNHLEIRKKYPRILEAPFDSDRKRMSTAHQMDGEDYILTKGSPDGLLDQSNYALINGELQPLTKELKRSFLEKNKQLAEKALRVLGFAYKKIDERTTSLVDEEKDLVFVGLAGMMDPPREEVKEAIRLCHQAGIKVVMITGDHALTALAIGKELGLTGNDDVITGPMIEKMKDKELNEKAKTVTVFARVSPHHKVAIVKALQSNGEISSMTGDGVNDAPALKQANIGVAMGITGTDVSKEASDIVLMDDNFTTIVDAVEEGRVIFSNIRKFVGFLMSCNVGEVLLIFIAMMIGWGSPLLAIQILWINLVTDSLPAFALGLEPKENDVMQQAPMDKDAPIVNKSMGITVIFQSIFLATAVLISFYLGREVYSINSVQVGQTLAFITIITGELLRMYSARSESKTLFEMNPFNNAYINGAFIIGFGLLMVVLYVPGINALFGTNVVYSMNAFLVAISLGFLPLIGGEISKVFKKIRATH